MHASPPPPPSLWGKNLLEPADFLALVLSFSYFFRGVSPGWRPRPYLRTFPRCLPLESPPLRVQCWCGAKDDQGKLARQTGRKGEHHHLPPCLRTRFAHPSPALFTPALEFRLLLLPCNAPLGDKQTPGSQSSVHPAPIWPFTASNSFPNPEINPIGDGRVSRKHTLSGCLSEESLLGWTPGRVLSSILGLSSFGKDGRFSSPLVLTLIISHFCPKS